MSIFGSNKIPKNQRDKDFYGVEGGIHIDGGPSSLYIPTDMKDVKNNTSVGLLGITQAKLRLGMYPRQKSIARVFGEKQKPHA